MATTKSTARECATCCASPLAMLQASENEEGTTVEDRWVAHAIESVASPHEVCPSVNPRRVSSARQTGSFRGLRVAIRRKAVRRSRSRVSIVTNSRQSGKKMRQSRWRNSNEPSFASSGKWSARTSIAEVSDHDRLSEAHRASAPESEPSRWKRWTHAPSRLKRSKKAKVMYSISFYPWKREPNAYYSSPEAAAAWVPDTASSRCQICLAAFNIARRRHHCRLCGHLVCNDCSLQRTFLPFSEDSRSQTNHLLIKTGAPQRTCNCCASTLKKMAMQNDHRVKEITTEVDDSSGHDSRNGTTSSTGASQRSRRRSAVVNHSFGNQIQLLIPRGVSTGAAVREDELEQVLDARERSRKSCSVHQHIISSEWLEQWLQYVNEEQPESMETGPQGYSRSLSRSSSLRRKKSPNQLDNDRPGPITNYSLLDFLSGKLVPKGALQRSRGSGSNGDYHVISREVWLVFRRLYGGGPSIYISEEDSSLDGSKSTQVLVAPRSNDQTDRKSRGPECWVITVLDDSIEQDPTHFRESRPQAAFETQHHDVTLKRSRRVLSWRKDRSQPASTAVIPSLPQPPSPLQSQFSRKASGFIGYWKCLRHSDKAMLNETSRTTISQVNEGVVLFDPAKDEHIQGSATCEDDDDFNAVHAEEKQRDTIAAVSAFAQAAAESRRKSTMSLMRHSTALSQRKTPFTPRPQVHM